jgi:hypothetical protein
MKKIIIYLVIFALLCAGSSYGLDYMVYHKLDKQSPYYLSFASIGAFSLESQVDCWATINKKLTNQELSIRLEELTNYVGVPFINSNVQRDNTPNGIMLTYKYSLQDITYLFKAEVDKKQGKSFLLINICSSRKNLDDLRSIENKLKSSQYKWKYYYLYTGKLEHYLNQDSQAKVINVLMENLEAQQEELYKDQNMISVAGYSPLFNNCVKVQNKKLNVQVAIKSDMNKDDTIIYIGQPLILGDY